MKGDIDLYFTYRHTLRFMVFHKLGGAQNTYAVPNISKLLLQFSLKKLEDIDSVEVYNYFYLFRYFLGWKASLTKLKSKYSLGKWYHSFNVKLVLNNPKKVYPILFYFFNNILKSVDSTFVSAKFFSKHLNIFSYIVKDLNVFSELKTNLGLFNLKRPLNFKIFFNGADFHKSSLFLNNIKGS